MDQLIQEYEETLDKLQKLLEEKENNKQQNIRDIGLILEGIEEVKSVLCSLYKYTKREEKEDEW